MAFDAADHGLGQRYFLTSLRAAHQVDDLPLCAHILADLSFQAASRGHAPDAVTFGEAARSRSRDATAAARASALSRLAFAYATAGQETDFERARDQARELRALFEGAWLSVGYCAQGELEAACRTGRVAARRLANVQSPRSVAVLEQLAAGLRRRQGDPHVRDFLPELQHALAQHPRLPAQRATGRGAG